MIDLKSLYGGDLNLLTGRQRDVLRLLSRDDVKLRWLSEGMAADNSTLFRLTVARGTWFQQT